MSMNDSCLRPSPLPIDFYTETPSPGSPGLCMGAGIIRGMAAQSRHRTAEARRCYQSLDAFAHVFEHLFAARSPDSEPMRAHKGGRKKFMAAQSRHRTAEARRCYQSLDAFAHVFEYLLFAARSPDFGLMRAHKRGKNYLQRT
jgi:hypothetical protein